MTVHQSVNNHLAQINNYKTITYVLISLQQMYIFYL